MLTAFWEAAGGKLADRWATVAVPALVFWLGGLLAWAHHRGGLDGLPGEAWFTGQTSPVQVAAILIALLGVAASGALVERTATPVLRLLEGYWPAWSRPLRRRLCDTLARRAAAETDAWQRAHARLHSTDPTADDFATYARLERRRRRRPAAPAYFMPTPIGNILRAAERRPADKYGLDTIAVWPHLWLLLPDSTRTELRAARSALDSAVGAATWGVLFCAFAPLAWWAVPVGLVVATVAVTVATPARAQAFGELVEAAYDLHRAALYQQLRWPLPANPEAERGAGAELSTYLWRGSDSTTPTFTPLTPEP
ncbi:hypothetical protein [Phytohabitans houttuyneae]|uniref:Vegetative cell wall protein gp1 n=1 Tax=Phytohabitans houttuyneae TaxID=1076126 RepID=A0A6V8KEN3_9ACTN|nr:hypothetical protein [Phytohabitans houttuyneae]GFJ80911.1 hypothetical protein Phou_050910 [Phytohabitans houttuyneae]